MQEGPGFKTIHWLNDGQIVVTVMRTVMFLSNYNVAGPTCTIYYHYHNPMKEVLLLLFIFSREN